MTRRVTFWHASNPKIAAVASQSGAAAVLGCFLVLFGWSPAAGRAGEDQPGGAAIAVVATAILPEVTLAEPRSDIPGSLPVTLGGLSDMVLVERPQTGTTFTLRMLTDRGPTNKITVAGEKRRVFLNPSFAPKILDVVVSGFTAAKASATPVDLQATIRAVRSLRTGRGKVVTGRPNGLSRDESVAKPDGTAWLPPDPDGVDPEGLAIQADGSWWITEEYRPSLLYCDSKGTALTRYVPRGIRLREAEMDVYDNLPARYSRRKDNRGFEATALSPDEKILWALLQSPLEFPDPKAAAVTGNVRLLAFDTVARRPAAEYIYRLGDPVHPAYSSTGVRPEDGKLCAMAAIDENSLLVLEQSDAGEAKLYRCRWKDATDTLSDDRPFEVIGNLREKGITCLEKTLVADLALLLPQLAADITDGRWRPEPGASVSGLKLEGLAILDSRHVIIGNDNDFNVDHLLDHEKPARRSCLWVIELGRALGGTQAQSRFKRQFSPGNQ